MFALSFKLKARKNRLRRIRERYLFLRSKFGLNHEEAKRIAAELETWWRKNWHESSRTG